VKPNHYFFCLVSLVSIISSNKPAFAQSYPLVCTAGATMNMYIGVINSSSMVQVRFNPSNRSAASGVPPGSCAWTDRGWRSEEPAQFLVKNVGKVTGSFFSNGSYSSLEFERGDVRNLERITRNNGGTFVFQVHRVGTSSNGGWMEVDRVGP
jgi:hypothetical protein